MSILNIKRKISLLIGLITVIVLNIDATGAVVTSFRWFSGPDSLTDNNGVNIALGGATVLTYLSPDATINFDTGTSLQAAYGNDFLYESLANTKAGRYQTAIMEENSLDSGFFNYANYYAYAVILDLAYTDFINTYGANVANVPIGTYFAITEMGTSTFQLQNLNTEPPGTSQDFNAGALQTDLQVVPEPATAVMLVLGIGTVLIKRRKKS